MDPENESETFTRIVLDNEICRKGCVGEMTVVSNDITLSLRIVSVFHNRVAIFII